MRKLELYPKDSSYESPNPGSEALRPGCPSDCSAPELHPPPFRGAFAPNSFVMFGVQG